MGSAWERLMRQNDRNDDSDPVSVPIRNRLDSSSETPETSPSLGPFEARRRLPYIETCIEAFGVERCMFQSNFPRVDASVCSYRVLWNALTRSVVGASREEKAALFNGSRASIESRYNTERFSIMKHAQKCAFGCAD